MDSPFQPSSQNLIKMLAIDVADGDHLNPGILQKGFQAASSLPPDPSASIVTRPDGGILPFPALCPGLSLGRPAGLQILLFLSGNRAGRGLSGRKQLR